MIGFESSKIIKKLTKNCYAYSSMSATLVPSNYGRPGGDDFDEGDERDDCSISDEGFPFC